MVGFSQHPLLNQQRPATRTPLWIASSVDANADVRNLQKLFWHFPECGHSFSIMVGRDVPSTAIELIQANSRFGRKAVVSKSGCGRCAANVEGRLMVKKFLDLNGH